MIPVLIVPTLSNYSGLQAMLDSIDYPVGHVIVVDNGERCPDMFCPAADRLSIVHLPANIGVAASWNLGIKLTPFANYWLFASDDVTFNPNKLALLPEIGPMGIVQDWSHQREATFAAFSISEDVVRSVGLFDEYYWPGCGEDKNFIARCKHRNMSFKCLLHWYDHPEPGKTRRALPNAGEWLADNFSKSRTIAVRGFDLDRRIYMENAYLKSGPPTHATSE